MKVSKNIKIKTSKISPKTFLKENIYDDLKTLQIPKKKIKVSTSEFEIPEFHEYDKLLQLNYNVAQLKSISRFYKQKVSGNKQQLIFRLYNYLKYSLFSIKIQKMVRGYLFRTFLNIHGPAIKNRKCTNEKDFLTFENVKDIPFEQFYSYKDKDNFIYGFDICTLYNMLQNNDYKKNPYNRNDLPDKILKDIKRIVKMGRKLNFKTNIKLQKSENALSSEKKMELRAIEIFQKMDNMGYITDASWITNLTRSRCIKYIRELQDVWDYRAQISNEIKHNICPNGSPFYAMHPAFATTKTELFLKNTILTIINKLISSGINEESRSLGCMYVLGTMTIVSVPAANSLPWLYESFMLNQQ